MDASFYLILNETGDNRSASGPLSRTHAPYHHGQYFCVEKKKTPELLGLSTGVPPKNLPPSAFLTLVALGLPIYLLPGTAEAEAELQA